jgi:phosphate transport system protein
MSDEGPDLSEDTPVGAAEPTGLQAEIGVIRDELGELATRVLQQVERAVSAWLEGDLDTAKAVIERDADIDRRSAALEGQIMSVHQRWSTFASDLRLLHMGLIEAVALERVGNLATEIAKLAIATPEPERDVQHVQDAIRAMGKHAVDALSRGAQAVVRADVEAGEGACDEWRRVEPMLEGVLSAVSGIEEEQTSRRWSASAVLVARHLERVANNACELGSRVRFMVTGEPRVETRTKEDSP